ncbi:MAG: hypothetical protein JWQ87_656 [Candidatus Sulfotelmatobacter sp.]|nr:hypothetical protein [Candidatus Sulfotelmatobacter sp.]
MKLTPILRILIIWILATFTCAASTINVPAQQPTIQDGINAANNGDTVLVAPGTYVENINFLGKAITVASSGGAKVTIINGNGLAPVAAFVTGEGTSSVLSGFTLENGTGTFAFSYQGGGVSISFASPTIRNNVITANNANSGEGGGIGVYFGSPIVTGNVISNNSASFGGGVSVIGSSTAKFLHNVIRNNTAGAGAAFELNGAGTTLIADNTIVHNSVGSGQGGGLYIINESDEIIVQNLITWNTAGSGSQIYSLIPQSVTGFALINNTIVSSSAGTADAAVIADGFNTNAQLINNIILARGSEAALLCNPIYQDGPPIVHDDDAFSQNGISYGDSCTGFSGQNGNISADPVFVNLTLGNYQLQSSSPAINAGTNSAPDLPKKDFAGHPRIVGGFIDMGAYEFQ